MSCDETRPPLSHWLDDPLAGSDSPAWRDLFLAEYARSGSDPAGLYGIARGLRCLGVKLRANASGGYRMAPPPEMDYDDLETLAGEHFGSLVASLAALDVAP